MLDKRKNSGKHEGDKPELLSRNEMNKLLEMVADDIYYLTLYKFLKFTGRRIGEVYGTYRKNKLIGGIKLKDIDFENNTVKTIILKTKKQKVKRNCVCGTISVSLKDKFCHKCGKELPLIDINSIKKIIPEEKIISMRPELVEALKLFINNHTPKFKKDDYIYRDKSLKSIQKNIKKHIKKAGIDKKFSLHGFRHYFISNAIKNGLSDQQIIKTTGHKDVSSLSSYNQLVPEDIKEVVNSMDI